MNITDDMVEAGAQAIRVALMRVPPRRDWSQTSERAREYFRREARACLEAALALVDE